MYFNISAMFTSTLTSKSFGTVNITFKGTRIDDYGSHSPLYNYGQPIDVTTELLTDDPKIPAWGWNNGTKIERQGATTTTASSVPAATIVRSSAHAAWLSTTRVCTYLGSVMMLLVGLITLD